MAIDQRLWNYIRQGARQRGLDPRAVGAVALSEGGLRYGAVGDAGTSFGPFQLHVGGALPQGRGASWANSPAGIDYALDQIARVARGRQGRQAIAHIVKRFERPADPASEISRAWQHYQTLGEAASGMVSPPRPGTKNLAAQTRPVRPQIVQPKPYQVFDPGAMGQGILSQFAQGGNIDFSVLPGLVSESWKTIKPSPLKKVPTQVVQQRGVVDPDGDLRDPVEVANPRGSNVLKAAAKQIGRPYVWGGESRAEGGFDCSGLIQWAYSQVGINLPRTTYDQIHAGRNVLGQPLQPGDLIFPHTGHVVMYVGGGKVIAAPYTGTVVQYQPLSKFSDPVMVRRVLPSRKRASRPPNRR
jgi:hypothetical protein